MIRPIDEYRAMSTEQLQAQLERHCELIRAHAKQGNTQRYDLGNLSHKQLIQRVLKERGVIITYTQPIVSNLTRNN